MHLGLIDILEAEQYEQPINIERQLASIQKHLFRLLNARQGSLQHLPDYGLPDLNQIFQELPFAVSDLTTQLKTLIEKYEPRLINVKIIEKNQKDKFCILAFNIYGTIMPAYPVMYSTYFLSGGYAEVLQR